MDTHFSNNSHDLSNTAWDAVAEIEYQSSYTDAERADNRQRYHLPSQEKVARLYASEGLAACVARWGHLYSPASLSMLALGRIPGGGHERAWANRRANAASTSRAA